MKSHIKDEIKEKVNHRGWLITSFQSGIWCKSSLERRWRGMMKPEAEIARNWKNRWWMIKFSCTNACNGSSSQRHFLLMWFPSFWFELVEWICFKATASDTWQTGLHQNHIFIRRRKERGKYTGAPLQNPLFQFLRRDFLVGQPFWSRSPSFFLVKKEKKKRHSCSIIPPSLLVFGLTLR